LFGSRSVRDLRPLLRRHVHVMGDAGGGAARAGDAGLLDDGELTSGAGVAPRVLSLSVQPGWPQQRAQAFFEVFGQTRLRQHHRCARFKSALFDGAEGVAGEDDHGDVAGARVVF